MVANFWISRKLRLASASLPPAAAVRHWATTVMQWWNCDKDQVPRRLSRWDAGVRSAKQPRDRQVTPGSIEPKEAGLLAAICGIRTGRARVQQSPDAAAAGHAATAANPAEEIPSM